MNTIRIAVALLPLLSLSCAMGNRPGISLEAASALASAEPKPFVIVGSDKAAGQGVVISPDGHVLTAAHVPFGILHGPALEKAQKVAEAKAAGKIAEAEALEAEAPGEPPQVQVGFRVRKPTGFPAAVHRHEMRRADTETGPEYEERCNASVIRDAGKISLRGKDVALLTIDGGGTFPHIPFYSKGMPAFRAGETLHICQYVFADNPGDIFFMVNPLKVIGVVDTAFGVQILAYGYFRWGSSGSAILKDGKLVGIQSNAYTINARSGDIALGYLSFEVVCEDLVHGLMARKTP